ncbi:MAG: TraB/GumN family protein [Pseudomonadota bacterium]
MRPQPRRLATLLLVLLLPAQLAWAACAGRDLSGDWDAAFRAQLDARVAHVPFAEGRFWEVRKAGRSSVLFGTIHMAEDDIATPPPALAQRIRTADEVFVEVTRAEEQRLMRKMILNPGFILNPEQPPTSATLSAQEWQVLRQALGHHRVPETLLDQMAPWYLTIALSTPPCMMAHMATGKQILDRRIETTAERAGVIVTGLEKPEDAFAVLEAVPHATQIDMLRAALVTAEMAEDYLATTKALYVRGQIAKIWAFGVIEAEIAQGATAQPAMDALYDALLVKRNDAWMKRLLPALIEGNRVVAVGALHLPGEHGLLAQLQAQGFTVKPLVD